LSSLYSVFSASLMHARSSQSAIMFALLGVLFLWVEGVENIWVGGRLQWLVGFMGVVVSVCGSVSVNCR
jgi:hypothetical protein